MGKEGGAGGKGGRDNYFSPQPEKTVRAKVFGPSAEHSSIAYGRTGPITYATRGAR